MNDTRLWKTRYASTEYGPYTDEEMAKYVAEGRINTETEVQHPQHTRGTWMAASEVIALAEKLSPTVNPPPVQNKQYQPAISQHFTFQRRCRKSKLPLIFLGSAFLCVCFGVIVMIVLSSRQITQRAEREIIRAYLKRETPTGKWEEISWSEDYAPNGTPVTRLDFRTENPFGGTSKHHISARYLANENKVLMAGWGIDFIAWIDPSDMQLPPVAETKLAEDHRPQQQNPIGKLFQDANSRMERRNLGD